MVYYGPWLYSTNGSNNKESIYPKHHKHFGFKETSYCIIFKYLVLDTQLKVKCASNLHQKSANWALNLMLFWCFGTDVAH